MPVHDWTRAEEGVFHAFRHHWVSAICDALNGGVLPPFLYALPEQAAFGPVRGDSPSKPPKDPRMSAVETDMEFYRRKATPVVVRHVTGDRVVAMIEIVSPGNKSTASAMRSFVEKAAELLERRIHLLVIDLLPPGPRDPDGIHAAIWEEVSGQMYAPPPGKDRTLAAYESGLSIRTYVRPVAVADPLPDMPLFLEPNACVDAPLEATYQTAFAAMPRRWRTVLDPARG